MELNFKNFEEFFKKAISIIDIAFLMQFYFAKEALLFKTVSFNLFDIVMPCVFFLFFQA